MTARRPPGHRIAHAASGNAPLSATSPPRAVRVFAPASISNIGPGFDIFGLALERPGDEVVVRAVPGSAPGIVSVAVTGDDGRVPTDPARNAAALAVRGVLDRADAPARVAVDVHKGIPLASGLGGSGASAVAGAVAANVLLGRPLGRTALLECAMIGEHKGSGANHADNAAPSLIGGFVLVLPGDAAHPVGPATVADSSRPGKAAAPDGRPSHSAASSATTPPRMVPLPTPDDLVIAVAHPHMEVETRRAREALGNSVALAAGIRQWGNAAGMVAGLHLGDWELIARCLHDAVAEPVRAGFVPGFHRARAAAVRAGAVGAGLSGSGPTVFAFCRGEAVAEAAGAAMAAAFGAGAGVGADVFVSRVNRVGARVIPPRGAGDSGKVGRAAQDPPCA